MTALTLNGSAVAATTLAAAGKFFNATGGTSGNTSTKVGSGTLFKQIFAKGTTTNQTGVSSIPAPTDSNFNGWMWDVTTLEGQLLQAGTLTPTIHLLASTGTTVTPTVQWFKRTSGGVYTQLATVAGSSIALTTSSQALTFTAPSMSDTAFATGDKLVMWLWVNQTAGGATNSTISVVEATSASSAGVVSEAQTVTQNGYIPIVTTTYSFTELLIASANKPTNTYSAVVLADSPIRYYRLGGPSGPTITDAGSQAQNGTPHGTLTYSQVGLITQDPDHAILFDGSTGYITLPATGLPTGASAWSMECWAQISATPTNFESLIDFGTRTTNEDVALFFDTAGKVNVGFDGGGNVLGTTISLNVPHHLVGTYDGTTLKLYIDGSLVGTPATTTGGIVAGAGIIGAVDSSGGLPFGGNIDEVALYSSALSAVQVATHYSAGISSFGTLTTTETSLPTESLPAAESLLATETDFPADSLSASAFGNLQAWGIDALVASDSLLILDTAIPVESLTVTDSLLKTDVALPTDSLSIVESVLVTGVDIPTEAGTITESMLAQGTGNLTDSLVVAESILATDTDIPTEALTVSDALLTSDGSSYIEANSASDTFLGSGTSQATESLSITDALLKVSGYVPLDSLTASDSQISGGAYLPLEGLTGVSSPLEWDIYIPGDNALVADDSASTMTQNPVGGGIVTTTYSFVDALSISESFTGGASYGTVDANTGSDAFVGQGVNLPTDGLSAADALLKWDIYQPSDDALTANDSFASAETTLYSFVDSLSATTSVVYANGASMAEANSALDTLLMRMGYAPFETLSLADASTANGAYLSVESLSLLDVFHALIIAGVPGTAVILDQLIALASLNDSLVSVASLNDQSLANAVLMDKLG